jgi:hypothetical protein
MKNTVKPVLFTAIITISAFFAVLYSSSCKEDKCKSVACAYGGSCDQGVCKCLPGYSGPNCETIMRKKFIGLWQVHEQGSVTPDRQYPISIENGGEVPNVLFRNYYNYFSPAKITATINGDTITIPNQQVMGKVIFGKGYIYTTPAGPYTGISMRYEVIDSATQMVDDFGYYEELDNSKPSIWSKQ